MSETVPVSEPEYPPHRDMNWYDKLRTYIEQRIKRVEGPNFLPDYATGAFVATPENLLQTVQSDYLSVVWNPAGYWHSGTENFGTLAFDYPLDPTKHYTVRVDWECGADPQYTGLLDMFSVAPGTDLNNSDWDFLGSTPSLPGGTRQVTTTVIGPSNQPRRRSTLPGYRAVGSASVNVST